DLEGINEDLQIDLDNATAQVEQNRQDFLAELEQFQSSYDKTRESFDNLKADMDNATAEQIETFQAKLDAEQSKLRQKQLDLQATEKKLDDSDTLLQDALTKLEAIKPKPDQEAQAYKPDAQIVRIDSQNGIIYLDAGIKDHVYRGLTFAIYDRNKPIPENGEGKAEIEVFQVSEQVSAARIVKSDTKDPIAKEDIVANLIWDRNTPNQFVVAGDFDFNNDGLIDADGAQRIAELIERYGGTVADTITVDTDFLIVGVEPVSLRRPTQQELDIDPMAQQRYEMSAKKIEAYNQILGKAGSLGIPVFNQKRFLYLIGYDTLMRKNPML
ncbi:MAG: BRCT domain-containing protein, partial [Planctomycetota bacterium]